MNRREFLQRLAALPLGAALFKPQAVTEADDCMCVLSAHNAPAVQVYLNNRNVSDLTTRCKVHKQPGKRAFGWMDIAVEPLHFDASNDIVTTRKFGLVKWEPLC